MSEDQIESMIQRAAKVGAKAAVEEFHRTCPSYSQKNQKILNTFADGSTPESAQSLAAFGKRIHEACTKLTSILLWIIIGSAVWIAGATTFSKFTEIFKGTPKP